MLRAGFINEKIEKAKTMGNVGECGDWLFDELLGEIGTNFA